MAKKLEPINDSHTVDYTDQHGMKRRVRVPAGVSDYREGIPVSLDADRLFDHCSPEFRQMLVNELWARGLVEPCDFKQPGAPELVRAAILACVKKDALDVVSLANNECRS